MSITCRPATPEDRTFIIDAWLSSFRTSYAAGIIPMNSWHGIMWPTVEGILDRPSVQTLVACAKSDPAFLYGFITGDLTPQLEHGNREWPAMIWYCYVKAPFRQQGIARRLFDALGVEPRARWLYACKTPMATKLATKIPMARWNPIVARFTKETA